MSIGQLKTSITLFTFAAFDIPTSCLEEEIIADIIWKINLKSNAEFRKKQWNIAKKLEIDLPLAEKRCQDHLLTVDARKEG